MTELHLVAPGGMKCGTTTLYRLLDQHPRLAFPKDKESPVFHQTLTGGQADAFLDEAFRHADPDALRVKFSPHYLADADAARRLAGHSPKCRILVLVRNPIERARSHHMMLRRNGSESRSLEVALTTELSDGGANPEWTSQYLTLGRWHQHIPVYRELFDEVLVVPLADLHADPQQVIDQVCRLAGIESFVPAGLGQAFNASDRPQSAVETAALRLSQTRARRVGRLLPPVMRRRAAFWLAAGGKSTRPDARPRASLDLSPTSYQALSQYFAADFAYLSEQHGISPDRVEL